jgi:pimeloyl-ACP methyl ester carboxylesterase
MLDAVSSRGAAVSAETIFFTRDGKGEPLLLIHGIGSRREVWDPVIPEVRSERDTFAVDLPGFNGTPLGDVVPTVEGYADALVEFCAERGIGRPHVAGNSLGGAIAFELGTRGLARSVTAFAPIGFWGTSGLTWCQFSLRLFRRVGPAVQPALPVLARTAVGRASAAGLFYGKPASLDRETVIADSKAFLSAPAFDAACDGFGQYVFGEPGALTSMPVTCVWGGRDLLLPYRTQARRARHALPTARHLLLRGCGHVPFFDDPTSCGRILLGRWPACGCGEDVRSRSICAASAVDA